jgi:hypothetical protein
MHSFAQRAVVILYPGERPEVHQVTGEANTILEVSVGPFPDIRQFMRETVRPLIDNLLQPLGSL